MKNYRYLRKLFIDTLKYYYELDYYALEINYRKKWLRRYIESRRDFQDYLDERLILGDQREEFPD